MNVVFCVNHFHPLVGGAEHVVRTLAEYFAKDHNVFVVTRRVQYRSHKVFDKYRVIEYSTGDVSGFLHKIGEINPDVVMCYSDVFDFFRHLVIMPRKKFRLIISLCGANWIYQTGNRNFANLFIRNIDNIYSVVCHSVYERDYSLCSNSKVLPKTVIIPNGISLEEFDNNHFTREELCSEISGKRWILNVSNFFPGKGQHHVVDVIENLPEPDMLVYIQISNDIDFPIGLRLESDWKKYVKLKLPHIETKFFKNLPREQVIGFFKRSNLFLCGSEKEVAPLVLLESMASSLPWVSMNVGNAVELHGGKCIKAVKDRRFYCHFDERVKNLFIDSASHLLHNPDIGEKGDKQVRELFNWDKILPQYRKIVEI